MCIQCGDTGLKVTNPDGSVVKQGDWITDPAAVIGQCECRSLAVAVDISRNKNPGANHG